MKNYGKIKFELGTTVPLNKRGKKIKHFQIFNNTHFELRPPVRENF